MTKVRWADRSPGAWTIRLESWLRDRSPGAPARGLAPNLALAGHHRKSKLCQFRCHSDAPVTLHRYPNPIGDEQ